MCSWSRHLSRQLHRVGVRCEVPAAPGWGVNITLHSALELFNIDIDTFGKLLLYSKIRKSKNKAATSIDVIIHNWGTLQKLRNSAGCSLLPGDCFMLNWRNGNCVWHSSVAIVPVSSVMVLRVQAGMERRWRHGVKAAPGITSSQHGAMM